MSTFTLSTVVPFSTTQQIDNFLLIEAAIRALQDATTGGSVTSVAMTVPSILSVAGSPITSSGTLAVTLATQTANKVFASATSGGAATPAFRSLVVADLPLVTGTYGGTGINNGAKTLTFLKNISFTAADDTGVYTLPTGTKTLVATDVTSLASLTQAASLGVVGTIGTGVWQGTPVAIQYGGTNASTAQQARLNILPSVIGNTLKLLRVNVGETDVEWVTVSTGITSINSDSTAAQNIVYANNNAAAPTITTAGGTTTVNIPNATTGQAGIITAGTQTIAGAKTFSTAPIFSSLAPKSVLFLTTGGQITEDNTNFKYVSSVLTATTVVNTKTTNSGTIIQTNIITKSGNYTVLVTDYVVVVNTSANTTIRLPDITTLSGGEEFTIKWLTAAAGETFKVQTYEATNILDTGIGGAALVSEKSFAGTNNYITVKYYAATSRWLTVGGVFV